MWFCSILFVTFVDFSSQNGFPTAETVLGAVRGHYKHSYHQRIYSAFEGIPYAKPPVADLRFEEPQEVEPWHGVLNATKLYKCVQIVISYPVIGEEDCLHINVYVPRINPIPNENLDVVVHIHGGVFMFGDPQVAGPKYLMDRDIIYVNFNYRLGIFGFLSTGDDALPGNLGLKDQVFALKWIQDNIKFFGGNANSVTLTGLSTGAACVHLHYFSPLSKGLFHRGFSQSGVATAQWNIQTKPLEKAIIIGNSVGCYDSNTKDLVKCLKTKSAFDLYKNIGLLYAATGIPVILLGVVIESESATAFLTDYPYALLKKGLVHNVPWLTSITINEGIIGFTFLNHSLDILKNDFEHTFPYLLDYYDAAKEDDKPMISKKIRQFYFGDGEINDRGFVNLFGDRSFKMPFEVALRAHAKFTKSPAFAYVYGYENSFRSKNFFGLLPKGVSHTEDGALLYEMSLKGYILVPKKLSDSDVLIKDVLLDIVISFAKDGVPKSKNVNWTSVKTNDDIDYVYIENPNSIVMKQAKEFGSESFWASLPLNELNKFTDVKEEL